MGELRVRRRRSFRDGFDHGDDDFGPGGEGNDACAGRRRDGEWLDPDVPALVAGLAVLALGRPAAACTHPGRSS